MGCNLSKAKISRSSRRKMGITKSTWYRAPQELTAKTLSAPHHVLTKRQSTALCGRFVRSPSSTDEDFSTLLYLTGPRSYCVDSFRKEHEIAKEYIEACEAAEEKPAAIAQPETNKDPFAAIPLTEKETPLEMANKILEPYNAYVSYEGFHEHGFHVINFYSAIPPNKINIERRAENSPLRAEYSVTLDQLLTSIPEAIADIVKDDKFIFVFRDPKTNVACFFPRYRGWVDKLFYSLNERFGDKLKNIVIHRPVGQLFRIVVKYRTKNSLITSVKGDNKVIIASNAAELAKATGFPGEIKSNLYRGQ